MSYWRKKPVVIEAIRFNPPLPVENSPIWLKDALEGGSAWFQGGTKPFLTIKTLEGEMRADVGDWIIKGIKGELYPCKNDIFEATYEAAP